MLQIVTAFCALWTLAVFFMELPFWHKVFWGFPSALTTTTLAVLQCFFAWKAWRSHYFNKVDFLVNEFLKALMGDLPYRELMARHRLHNRWLSKYCYCPPTTNLVSVGFPEELYFVHDRGEELLWKRKVHLEGTPITEQLSETERTRRWDGEARFRMNDILLTITKIQEIQEDDDGQISETTESGSVKVKIDTLIKVKVNIDICNTLINESMEPFTIMPTKEDFLSMMAMMSKWEKSPDFSFIRYVYKQNYYGHCYNIKDFFDKVGRGELEFVMVRVPFGRRVLVG